MSKSYKVVVTDFIHDGFEPERTILGDIAEVIGLDARSEGELPGRIEDADAIMLYHAISLSRATIERLNRCRLIVRCGVGYDNVDHVFAKSRSIPVANVPDYGTEEVADSAIGMMLSLARGIHFLNSRLRGGEGFWSYQQAAPIHRLRGRTLGIIGLGRIGTATALRARALGMDVAFFDPYVPDGLDKATGTRRVSLLDELLAQAHVISVHCPLTSETHHIVDASAIAKMTRGGYLVNTARGGVVDTAAIPSAIAAGQLAGAGIDVLVTEPPDEQDPLIAAWRDSKHPAHHRLIVNPHSAFYCEEGLMEMRTKGAAACRRAILGEVLRNIVN